jgi:hypothetical protein
MVIPGAPACERPDKAFYPEQSLSGADCFSPSDAGSTAWTSTRPRFAASGDAILDSSTTNLLQRGDAAGGGELAF